MKLKNQFSLITLNMHCGMEENYEEKFEKLLAGINECDPDFILLQECAQTMHSKIITNNFGIEIRKDNQALKLVQGLKIKYNKNYYYYWNWEHYGFENLEEGSAILSKYPFDNFESKYVSTAKDVKNWKSRKVVKCSFEFFKNENTFKLNFYSVHLGWWNDTEEPFKIQADNLINWMNNDKNSLNIIAGDFNNSFDTLGYKYFIKNSKLNDLYLECNPTGKNDSTFVNNKQHHQLEGQNKNKRIDFIFSTKDQIKGVKSELIFTNEKFGAVSDHIGIFSIFKII